MSTLFATTLLAGMPSVDLTDAAKLRLSTISFFLMVFFVSTFAIWKTWNSLGKDLPQLPKISFRTALAGTFLWSVATMIVLTMISGARELMTPRAWEKVGWTYQLAEKTSDVEAPEPVTLGDRRRAIEGLRAALTASIVEGRYPDSLIDIPESLKKQPGISPTEYGYHVDDTDRGQTVAGPARRLAYEYDIYDDGRQFVLLTNGEVVLE